MESVGFKEWSLVCDALGGGTQSVILRKGGIATLVGNVSPKIEFPLQIAVTRELTIHGSCASRGDYPACLEMLARGALKPDPLISALAPLSEGPAWFDRLYRKETGLLKVVLKP